MGALLLVKDDDLVHRLGVADAQPEHEAVELRLGQREGALVLDRVLRGDDEERLRHRTGHAVDRHLPLLHGLEQRRLRLGRGPVDLVGEHDLADDRPGPELELLRLLVVDRQAGDVRRQQVGRELDAAEGAAEAPGDRSGQHRLAGPGHILDQQVALAQQRHEGEADLVVLADDDALDVGDDAVAGLLDHGHGLRVLSFIWRRCGSRGPRMVARLRAGGRARPPRDQRRTVAPVRPCW